MAGCRQDSCVEAVAENIRPVRIEEQRLEARLFAAKSVEDVRDLLKSEPEFANHFVHVQEYPSDSVLAAQLFQLSQDPYIDTLYQESVAAYADISDIKEQLAYGLGVLRYLFPERAETLTLQTTVTGLYGDLFISDTTIIVGIDYFNEAASYRPIDVPHYILKRYTRRHLPAVILKFLAAQHVQTGQAQTLLSEMVDYGKTYYLTKRMMPCTPDSILMGYSPKDMEVIAQNEAIIWANLVENQVLYETDHTIKRKFLGERPNVYEIHQDCPGRIGAWVGWQIVEAYMKNNSVTIEQLVNESDNNRIFSQSGYKPRVR